MIRQLGNHAGKRIVFGFDRYVAPELDQYVAVLSQFGEVEIAVDASELHYLSSAQLVCERVQGQQDHVGVLCCGTGMGMSIAANKFRGIYASRCLSQDDAEMARTINNSNALCLASKSGFQANAGIISAFMTSTFEGRKLDQLEHITQFELEHRSVPRTRLRMPKLLKKTA